jgi:hypothetical protein
MLGAVGGASLSSDVSCIIITKNMIRRILGVILFAFGVILAGWIAYNLLIERLPETQGRNPIVPSLVAIGLLFVGWKWIRGEHAG